MPGRDTSTPLQCSLYAKTHSASALSHVSQQPVQGYTDNDRYYLNTNNNNNNYNTRNCNDNSNVNTGNSCADVRRETYSTEPVISRVHFSSSDSDSSDSTDDELNHLPQVGYKETSKLKNTLLNVFSIKNRIGGFKLPDCLVDMPDSDVSPVSIPVQPPIIVPPLNSSKKSNAHSNPNIFKKIISRKAMVPKMKAFKRISDDLEIESSPFHDEIEHERIITSAIKADDNIFNIDPDTASPNSSFLLRDHNQHLLNYDNLKKFEIINKANESWNNSRRKSNSSIANDSFKSLSRKGSLTNLDIGLINHSSFIRRNSNNSISQLHTSSSTTTLNQTPSSLNRISKSKNSPATIFTPLNFSRKRKMNQEETDIEDYLSDDSTISIWNGTFNNKRRLVGASVANSPKSPAIDTFPNRRNSVLLQTLQNASDSLESMSLK